LWHVTPPPLYNPKCQHCPVYRPHGDVRTCRYESTQSRHNTRKSPMPKRRRVAPLNRRFLGGVCVPRESEREREREKERERERERGRGRALINNNSAFRSRFYWIQLFTASSVKKRLRGLCLCYFFPNILSPVVHTFIVECHCGSEKLFRHDAELGLCGHLAANPEKAPSRDVRSFRYPRAHPAQRAAPAAGSGWAV
ncbi:hypothetical protein PFLUV_G00163780, partial [Perca fluviatilis]